MKYTVHISSAEDGEYVADCPELGLSSRGMSPANALDSMRENIRYHIEFCPCSTVQEDSIQLDVS